MSWEQLLNILRENAEQRRLEQSRPPLACPWDGEPLQPAPDGGLFCKFDGWKWPEDADNN